MTDPERDALDVRPTAAEMLARIRADEPGARGRLRVYLGMAPGVGKTWKMLEEGHRRRNRGTDVVAGFVETHGRAVVSELVVGLEVVPRRRVEYRGVTIEEMDADAIVAREPTVALIDELAHTNIPGSARAKRWEDVEFIRDHGIHVVSTMNVQHLQSIADAVATITGAPIDERVPDEVLLGADEIELVDMSPHALRQRMKHGNVYPPERTRIALDKFFTEANLTALRELALRYVARQVEGQLEGTSGAQELRLVTERIVVFVDDSPAARRAVRRAAAIAGSLHGALVCAVIDTSSSERRPFDKARDLQETIDDAIDLGAEVVHATGVDVAQGLVEIARNRKATHLFVPYRPTRGIDRLWARPLIDRLIDQLPEVEIHLVGPSG